MIIPFKPHKQTGVKLYYYKYPNVGDMLNVLLPEKLFGVTAVEESFPTAEMIAVGSILDRSARIDHCGQFPYSQYVV